VRYEGALEIHEFHEFAHYYEFPHYIDLVEDRHHSEAINRVTNIILFADEDDEGFELA